MTSSNPALALTAAEQKRVSDVVDLASGGSAGISRLLDMLADASWTVRREVIAALGRIGRAAAAPLCDVLLSKRDSEARIAAAVDALVASADDVFDEVAKLATDENAAVVADCAQILGRRRTSRAIPILKSLVDHPNDNVSVAAIEALGRIGGPSAVDVLLGAVSSRNFFRVFPAIDVLGRSGDPRAIPPLASLLLEPTYALEAARALGKTGESSAVQPLVTLLSHPSETTTRIAAVALRELHQRHAERYGDADGPDEALRAGAAEGAAVRRLVRCLADADQSEQLAIAFILGVVGGDAAVAGLRGLLDAKGPAAESAASALKKLGPDSDLHIREALRQGDSARRLVLLPVVSRASAAMEVIECLRDSNATVRALACDALARVGAVSSISALFALLADPNPRVVQAAIGAIQSLGTAETRPLALEAAKQQNPAVRRSALRILAYFAFAEALPVFLGALTDDDPRTIEASLMGLAFLDDPRALEALLESARSPTEKTRSATMRAIGLGSKKDARIPAYLVSGLTDQGAWVRYYACQALGRLGIEGATDKIAALLDDAAGQVRVAAIEALSHFSNDVALAALTRAAEDGEPDVQRAALIGLGIAKRPEGVLVVLRAAQSPDPATRLVAISALADSGSPHALPTLAAAARDRDENVCAAAVGFIAALPAPEATAVLVDLLHEPPFRDRVAPLLAIANDGRVPGIMAALGNADDELALLLTSALARMRTQEARSALQQVMSIPWVPARKAAASALASLRTPEAIATLRDSAARDADPQVRQISAVLLGR